MPMDYIDPTQTARTLSNAPQANPGQQSAQQQKQQPPKTPEAPAPARGQTFEDQTATARGFSAKHSGPTK